MACEWLRQYLAAFPGAHVYYYEPWGMFRAEVGDKIFATIGGDKYGKPIFNFKVKPEDGETLRAMYEDIVPGYYMNKQHWISVYADGVVPRDLIERLAGDAYVLVFNALPKRVKEGIKA